MAEDLKVNSKFNFVTNSNTYSLMEGLSVKTPYLSLKAGLKSSYKEKIEIEKKTSYSFELNLTKIMLPFIVKAGKISSVGSYSYLRSPYISLGDPLQGIIPSPDYLRGSLSTPSSYRRSEGFYVDSFIHKGAFSLNLDSFSNEEKDIYGLLWKWKFHRSLISLGSSLCYESIEKKSLSWFNSHKLYPSFLRRCYSSYIGYKDRFLSWRIIFNEYENPFTENNYTLHLDSSLQYGLFRLNTSYYHGFNKDIILTEGNALTKISQWKFNPVLTLFPCLNMRLRLGSTNLLEEKIEGNEYVYGFNTREALELRRGRLMVKATYGLSNYNIEGLKEGESHKWSLYTSYRSSLYPRINLAYSHKTSDHILYSSINIKVVSQYMNIGLKNTISIKETKGSSSFSLNYTYKTKNFASSWFMGFNYYWS